LVRRLAPKKPSADLGEGFTRQPYSSKLGRLDPLIALTLGRWGPAEERLRHIIMDFRPDVVHWHNSRGFIGVPFDLPDAVNLYTAHDYTLVCPKSMLVKPDMSSCEDRRNCILCSIRSKKPPQLWRIGRKRTIRPSPNLKILAPSEFMAKALAEDGIRTSHVLRTFTPDPGEPSWSRTEEDILVYTGLLERHKGVRTLLDAFVRSRDRQGFRLFMIGEGGLKNELREVVAKRGLSDRVKVPGFMDRSEMDALRRKAVAQVVPSEWYENSPSVAIEALSLGTPVIASSAGGLPEIIGSESGSALFKAGDVTELAEELVRLWNDRSGILQKRKKARETYVRRFAPEKHVSDYLEIIREASPNRP
jgi:glycosyltransferase involved in cell wall biosynthesis